MILPAVRRKHEKTRFDLGDVLLQPGGAGHEIRRDASYFFDARRRTDRPHVVLQLTLSGQGFYQNRGGRHLLPAGTAWFDIIPGPFSYGYPPESREPYEQVFVSITGPAAKRWHRRITRGYGNVLRLGDDNTVAPLMLALAEQYTIGGFRDRFLISAQLYTLLMTLLSALERTRTEASPRVATAVRLIEQHARDPHFNVLNLADQLGVSREHLSRLFIAGTGMSPLNYLSQHRLRLAAAEMRSGSEKLESIARRCGFSSANYLCRAFRRRVGTSPQQFRQSPWLLGP